MLDPMTLSLIAAGAGKVAGAIGSAAENRKQENLLAGQKKTLQDYFNKEYYTPYTKTAEGAASLSSMRDQMKSANEKTEGVQAATGGTHEAVVASKGGMLDAYGKTVRDLSGMDTYRKQGLKRGYDANMSRIESGQMAQAENKSQQWSNLMGNTGQLIDAAGYEKLMGAPAPTAPLLDTGAKTQLEQEMKNLE